jgi:hypothetical protein
MMHTEDDDEAYIDLDEDIGSTWAWAVMEEEDEITAILVDPCTKVETELYDSGASQHMSPARDKFISYRPIEPRAIRAADKCVFYAIGAGDLQINVPNGTTTSNVLLKDALYAPEIGVTIVSVS